MKSFYLKLALIFTVTMLIAGASFAAPPPPPPPSSGIINLQFPVDQSMDGKTYIMTYKVYENGVLINPAAFWADEQKVTFQVRPMGTGPIINLTALLEGLNRGASDNNIPTTLEVECRTGGASADTALPANAVATCEVFMAVNGSGSNFGYWYNNISPTVGQNYYLVIRQKIAGVPVGANHIPVITANSWPIVSQPGSTTLDLTTSEAASFAAVYTPTGKVPALNSKTLGGATRLLMRAGYFALQNNITLADFNRWRDAYIGTNAVERALTNVKGEGDVTLADFNAWRDTYLAFKPNRDINYLRDIYVP